MQNAGPMNYDPREREQTVAKIGNFDELAGRPDAGSRRVSHGNPELKSPGLFHRQIKAIDDSIAHRAIIGWPLQLQRARLILPVHYLAFVSKQDDARIKRQGVPPVRLVNESNMIRGDIRARMNQRYPRNL